jgi:RimJ/RimL family protein N-acetyltransferase
MSTPHLLLEPLKTQHAAEMAAVLADARLYEFTGGEPPTLDKLRRRYQLQVGGPASSDEVWANWIIRERDSGCAAGYVQATLVRDDTGWMALLGWLVGTQFQRRGFAVAAVTEVIQHLELCGIVRLQAHIADGNSASVAVATRVGFVRTDSLDDEGERVYVMSTCRRDPAPNSVSTRPSMTKPAER